MFKKLFVLVCLLGLAGRTRATTCSSTVDPCDTTNHVSGSCDTTTSKCACTTPSTYTQITSGCGLSTSLDKPTVDATPYSGEVAKDESLTLTCQPPTGFAEPTGTTWAWYIDSTVQGTTTKTFTYTPTTVVTVKITCKVTFDGLSSTSDEFTAIAYEGGTDYTFTQKPVITGAFSGGATTGNDMVLSCINRPKDTAARLEYEWTTGPTQDSDLTLSAPIGAAGVETCTLKNKGGGTYVFQTPHPTANYGKTDTPQNLLDTKTPVVTFTPDVSTITIHLGDSIPVACGLSDASDILYTAADLTYKWYNGATQLTGTAATFDTTSLTAGTYNIDCRVTPNGGGTEATSATKTIVVVATSLSPNAWIKTSTSAPMENNYLQLHCFVYASNQDKFEAMTYSWTYDGAAVVGNTDNSLQYYAGTDAANGNAKKYQCTAITGTEAAIIESSAISFTAIAADQPVITSSVASGQEYGLNSAYTLTCQMTPDHEVYDVTYSWTAAGVAVTGTASTLSITATATSTEYKCRATSGGTNTLESTGLTVVGREIVDIVLTGVKNPMASSNPVYTCTVTLAPAGGTITYSIKVGGVEKATTSTYTVATAVAASHDGAYTCEATVGSFTLKAEAAGDSVTVAVVSTPAKPVVNGASQFNPGGSYALTCDSDSEASDVTETYVWKFTAAAAGSTEQTLSTTTKTHYVSGAAEANTGTYKCTVTISSVTSAESDAHTVAYGTAFGLPCTATNMHSVCGTDFTRYKGNCIANYCDCATGVDKTQDACGTASAVVVSMFTLTLSLLACLFM